MSNRTININITLELELKDVVVKISGLMEVMMVLMVMVLKKEVSDTINGIICVQ